MSFICSQFFNLLSGSTNPIVYISSVEPLNKNNYGSWREKIEIALALSDIDLAPTEARPTENVVPVSGEVESEDDFKQRMLNHAPIRQKYDTDRSKWESCLLLLCVRDQPLDLHLEILES
jgi:hypothetical protein